jgi:hypothetical protein
MQSHEKFNYKFKFFPIFLKDANFGAGIVCSFAPLPNTVFPAGEGESKNIAENFAETTGFSRRLCYNNGTSDERGGISYGFSYRIA